MFQNSSFLPKVRGPALTGDHLRGPPAGWKRATPGGPQSVGVGAWPAGALWHRVIGGTA